MRVSLVNKTRNEEERKAAKWPGAAFSNFLKSPWLATGAALGIRVAYVLHFVSHYSRHALGILPFLFESGNIAYSVATGQGFASPFHITTGPKHIGWSDHPLLGEGSILGSISQFPAAVSDYLLSDHVCSAVPAAYRP